MSKFNSSISTVGIKEPKVQQAILKLLENSLYQKERLGKVSDNLQEEIRRLKQKLSTIDFEIDDDTAQEIADKISEAIGDSVSDATSAAETATQKASDAASAAESAAADAQSVSTALENLESTIEEHAEAAARTAASSAIADATSAAQTASEAAQTATQKASAANTSATNAASTAAQAASAAQEASAAIASMHNVNLSGATTYNASYDQYRKIATLPAVDGAAGAWVTIYGAIGGFSNSVCKPIYVSLSQRQSDATSYSEIEAVGYVFGSSLPANADIVLYKESNNTFSLYLKGAQATYFRHNVAMMYNERVTAVSASFTTTAPTGTLVWSLVASNRIVSTTDHNHDSAYAAKNHNPDSAYAAANHHHDSAYAAANHNHDSAYAAKSHTHDYAASNHNHDSAYAPITREYVAWAHVNVDLADSTYNMSGLVSNSSATYNVLVTFRNTAATARTVTAGGKSASLASGNGTTATISFTATGSGTFTIDNIASSVDVFVRIWR